MEVPTVRVTLKMSMIAMEEIVDKKEYGVVGHLGQVVEPTVS